MKLKTIKQLVDEAMQVIKTIPAAEVKTMVENSKDVLLIDIHH